MKLPGLLRCLLCTGLALGCARTTASPGPLAANSTAAQPAAGPGALAEPSANGSEQRPDPGSDRPCVDTAQDRNGPPRARRDGAEPAPVAVASADRNAGSSKSHRAKIKELFQLMDMEKVLDAAVTESMAAQERANPALGQFRDIMLDFLHQYMSWKSLERGFVDDYMETFSETEIEDMVAFYKTPSGAKAISAVPSLLKRGTERGMGQVEKHLPELQKRIQERMKE